jgi:hypothetical protein
MKTSAKPDLEERTARLTILIEPRKKAVFEELCDAEDSTPSQVVRRMIRDYIEQRLRRPWTSALQAAPVSRHKDKREASRR